jgi:hypothetical protein
LSFKNNEWEYLLKGNPQALNNLSEIMGSYYFHIYNVPSHNLDCNVDDNRMTSVYCNDEDDINVVWQVGYELVSLFNGAACLYDTNFSKIEIEAVWRNEKPIAWIEKNGAPGLLGKPDLNSMQIQEEHRKSSLDDPRFRLVNLATENEDIYLILKYFDMEPSWTTYYKTLETVETLAKKESVAININTKERKSFTNVANNYSLSGLDSRHGFKQNIKNNNTKKMTMNEAHQFIRSVAMSYLKQKYNL